MNNSEYSTIKKRKVIFDHNGINDDMVSLMLLLTAPNIELVAVLVTPAACLLKDGIDATVKVLSFFGKNTIPVAGGQVHGSNPFPYDQRVSSKAICSLPQLIHLERNRKQVSQEDADELLVRKLMESEEPVTLFLAAPPTNLIAALKKSPEIRDKIEEVIVIGGAVGVSGNVMQFNHDSSAEWNFFWDPKSTKRLLNSKLKLTLFPLDLAEHFPNDLDLLKQLAKQSSQYDISDLACQIWAPSFSHAISGDYRHYMCDVLAAAYLGCDHLTTFKKMELDSLIDIPHEGKVVKASDSGNWVNVANQVDFEAYKNYYLKSFAQNIQINRLSKFSSVKKRKVFFDHDGATDDIVSLQLLLSMDNIELLGISIIPSDCLMDDAVESTLKLLSLYGKTNVPVAKGTVYGPNPFPYEFRVYAKLINIMPLMINQKINQKQLVEEPAVDFMIRLIKESNEPVTMLLTGPCTNFVAAIEKAPEIKEKIEEVVWMGGAVDVDGNVRQFNHDGSAEWNIYYDPVASKKLFASGLNIALFSLDSTNQVPVNLSFLKKLADQKEYKGSYLASQIWTPTAKKIDTGSHDYTYCMWDVLAIGYLGCDQLTTFRKVELDVITKGPKEGKTERSPGNGHWVNVADVVNVDGFFRYYFSQLRKDLVIDEDI